MLETAHAVLTPWASFYAMTGSAAAALTGLMFVVITLVSQRYESRSHEGIATFSTPTLLHFCGALLISALLIAPWPSLAAASVPIGLTGAYGLIHMLRVMRRARRLSGYEPDAEDWVSYTILPLITYAALVAGSIALTRAPLAALFAVGGSTILLIFIGIRNAWDVVTFLVVQAGQDVGTPAAAAPAARPGDQADEPADLGASGSSETCSGARQ